MNSNLPSYLIHEQCGSDRHALKAAFSKLPRHRLSEENGVGEEINGKVALGFMYLALGSIGTRLESIRRGDSLGWNGERAQGGNVGI